jgi:biotin transporter BioY
MRAQDAGQKTLDLALTLLVGAILIGWIMAPFITGTTTTAWDSPSKIIFNALIIGAAAIILVGLIKHMTE